jgi:hypothetical protein
MAAIGFVQFATIALQVGQAALPAYRRKFAQHHYTPPPLLAILCLLRDEEWTSREADVRRAEHAARRAALQWRRVPD